MNRKELEQALLSGKYAWPGGYPLYFITDDGAALSFEEVGDNFELVAVSIERELHDGWGVIAVSVNWEYGELYCDHYHELIPSAYGEEA